MKPLSIVIITYNRPGDALELLQNIAGLDRAAELLQEVVLVNNASDSDYSNVKKFAAGNPVFKYIDSNENLGVTKGRNFALQFATAPVIIMLDDDAVLENKDALIATLGAFDKPAPDGRSTGIVSFRVLYYDTKAMQINALPHKQYKRYKNKTEFFTYYYAGGAHAVKRELLDRTGNYPEDFFYGMEEYDLAFRALDAGYAIRYDSGITMLHKESPLGRKPVKEKLRMMWVNKCRVAWRYLPARYYASTALMWSLEYLQKTGFDFAGFFKGWKKVLAIPGNEKKTPVGAATLDYLKSVHARLWY